MPLFEYICLGCNRRFTQLIGVTVDSQEPKCPICGSKKVEKLISRFARVRSEDDVIDSLEDTAFSTDMDDPKSMRRVMREMGKQMDEDGGEDFEELIEESEKELCDGESAGTGC